MYIDNPEFLQYTHNPKVMCGWYDSLIATLQDVRSKIESRPDEHVHKWAERTLNVPNGLSPIPGRYSTSSTPYVREPLECFRNGTSRLVLPWGAQATKTMTMMVGLLYLFRYNPENVIWAFPTEKYSGEFSRTKWQTFIKANPEITQLLSTRRTDMRLFTQRINEAYVWFVNSNSPTELSGRSARVIVADEVNKFNNGLSTSLRNAKEANALDLLKDRTKAYSSPLHLFTSTPTVPEGLITQEYESTTREAWNVECIHCRNSFVMAADDIQLIWDQTAKQKDGTWNLSKVKESAHGVCPLCSGTFNDGDKYQMIQGGEWVRTNLNALDSDRGFHCESIIAPWESSNYGSLACTFLKFHQKGDMRGWMNSYRALPYSEIVVSEVQGTLKDVVETSPDYFLDKILTDGRYIFFRWCSEIEFEPYQIFMTIDPGLKFKHFVIRGWTSDDRSYLLGYGWVESYQDLKDIANHSWGKFTHKYSREEYNISFVMIDSGWDTKTSGGVYDLCADPDCHMAIFPSRGNSYVVPFKESVVPHQGKDIVLHLYDDSTFKTKLYKDTIEKRLIRWYQPKNLNKDYFKMFDSEHLIYKEGKWQWVKQKGKECHYADCEKLQLVSREKFAGAFREDRRAEKVRQKLNREADSVVVKI